MNRCIPHSKKCPVTFAVEKLLYDQQSAWFAIYDMCGHQHVSTRPKQVETNHSTGAFTTLVVLLCSSACNSSLSVSSNQQTATESPPPTKNNSVNRQPRPTNSLDTLSHNHSAATQQSSQDQHHDSLLMTQEIRGHYQYSLCYSMLSAPLVTGCNGACSMTGIPNAKGKHQLRVQSTIFCRIQTVNTLHPSPPPRSPRYRKR